MNKLNTYLLTLLTVFTISKTVTAQDFYNGCRGPRGTQIDMYANFADGKTTGMIIPKVFTKNIDNTLPDLILAAPTGISEETKVENKGFNIGYIADNIIDNTSVIIATGLFKDNQGNYRIFNPQIYATHMNGPITIDAETNIPINLNNGQKGMHGALTAGYALNDFLRVGGSIIGEKGKEPQYQAAVRIELKKDHQFWLEGYYNPRQEQMGLRLAANF